MDRFLNPYNFVRPLTAPRSVPDNDPELHLLWRCPPPPHDRYTGLSGRITCLMTAKTPVFVSDSDIVSDDDVHKTYRFFNVNGQDMIPASSLRGPIRSIFEAATNSTFGVFALQDEPLFYRQPPEVALGLIPARVECNHAGESGYRLRLLTGSFELQIGSKNLYAAWIPCYPNEQILDKPERDRRGNSRHKHLLTQDDLKKIPPDLADGRAECWAYLVNTRYLVQHDDYHHNQRKGFPHWQVEHLARTEQEARTWFKRLKDSEKKQDQNGQSARYKLVPGYVYATGLNADVKQYERFFYYDGQQKRYVPLTPAHVDAYNHLMQDYYKRAQSIENSLKSQSDEGRQGLKPSYFVNHLEQLEEGTLVYVDLEGDSRAPTVRAIYPVAISRAMYDRTIAEIVRSHHPHLLPPTDIRQLCLASRVFGWVSQEGDEDATKEVAYRGRVCFSNALLDEATACVNRESLTLSILGAPHPTSLEFYLDNIAHIQAQRDGRHGYNEPGAKIRGRKIYRHHRKGNSDNFDEAQLKERSDQNRTIQGVYEPPSAWTFTIEFENLQPIELGALLWTLELREGNRQGYHRIGYGKPLGFGSVQIEVTGLELYDTAARYDLAQTGLEDYRAHKNALIQRFKKGMSRLYGQASFAQLDNIQDLLALLSERADDLPIHYPRLKLDRQAKDNEGFRWFMENRNGKQERLKPAKADDGLPYDVKAGQSRRNRR